MGDMDDVFRAMRADKQERHAANRTERAEILRKAGVRFETRNGGAHLIVEGQGGKIDFWPGTGKWIDRNRKNGRGINSLLVATINS